MENELNTIGKLPSDLANRAMVLLEKTTDHKMNIDHKIIALEENNQKMTQYDMRKFYFWSGFGIVCAYALIFSSIGVCIFLAYNDKPLTAIVSIIPGVLTAITEIIKALKFKNHKK
ncbi:hypothetical protein BJI48_09010 [Helicobacter sp. 11S02596-1]|nr:hypothetical protein BJI48_09010 [Helicobacter sp. 11S02596-1]